MMEGVEGGGGEHVGSAFREGDRVFGVNDRLCTLKLCTTGANSFR